MTRDKIFSVVLVIILVFAAFFSFAYFASHPQTQLHRKNLDLGPRVNYYVYDDPITDIANASRELSIIN
ncbi:hypothetical protein DMB44_09135, partial [Thermoplasma sp. Kam2015]|uniref:hypothetical protein n=1 Tax=Thermoplasma sp. Kam2015 TaxID=2094122 RepID=UPI000D8A4337